MIIPLPQTMHDGSAAFAADEMAMAAPIAATVVKTVFFNMGRSFHLYGR
ncbi:MAG: hypothetical protein QNJ92_05535 [Alphaproteobacteria bacterium]|nr:hypothetical protein [Alphaproteobacteria bacterium]